MPLSFYIYINYKRNKTLTLSDKYCDQTTFWLIFNIVSISLSDPALLGMLSSHLIMSVKFMGSDLFTRIS